MSRYEFLGRPIPDTRERYGIAVGWDEKLQTFWSSVYEAQDIIQEFGMERAEIIYLAHLSEKLKPYGEIPDGLAQRLIAEKGN